MMDFGFMILSGGMSSRMGSPKALLRIGGETLLERTARTGQDFSERLFSVNDPIIPTPAGFVRVPDIYAGCGPLGGLHACLSTCRSQALVVAPCDAPGYTKEAVSFLLEHYIEELDALILQDQTGRAHPLMGVYQKRCLPIFAQCLEKGHLKLLRALSEMNTLSVVPPQPLGQTLFVNLNTPQEYQAFLQNGKNI